MEKEIYKKVVNTDGLYSCDELDITVEEWKKVLQDSFVYNNYKLWLARFYQEVGHKASCKYMGEKYKCSSQTPNSVITKFGIATRKILNRFEVQGTDGKPTYWIIPMKQGREIKGLFEWTLRDELVQALEELDMTNPDKFEEEIDKIKTWQEIYEKSHWVKSDWDNKYFETVNIIHENVQNIHWSDDCIYRLLKSSGNGISSVNWGLTNEHYQLIKDNWGFYENNFNRIHNEKNISQELFDSIINKTQEITDKNYSFIINRAICGLLPGIMTTAPGIDFFYERLNLIKQIFPEIPEITDDWRIDNLNFVSYCKTQVDFKEEYHVSGFIFDLYDYCKSLQGDTQMTDYEKKLEEIKDNLLANHNVILTGAPGTGKTFMAKTIARDLGCSPEEIGFVQFHPSYDYTDFVEGLRPKQVDDPNQIGFERRDGVFKEFCERALKNLIDSKKSVEELSKEKDIEEILRDFIEEAKENKTELELKRSGNKFFILEKSNDKYMYVDIPNNPVIQEIPISYDEIISVLKSEKEFTSVKDIYNYFGRKWGTQQDSYILAIYEKLKNKIKTSKSETSKKIPLKNFVFIIDEINRGEVAKIFGELFFCVDPGYRGEKGRIKTQYQNLVTSGEFQKGFFIPENVYIIGTMNDIDRSVESMDFAFRRRFSWIEVKASDTVEMLYPSTNENGEPRGLESNELADEAKRRMEKLNAAISEIDDLNEAYHIGASYFLKLNNYEGTHEERFKKLWDYHLKGILQEYLRGNPNAKDELDKLKKAYNN